ncbi:MAG: YicC family protein [Deltaproteobacteria bacterium]|nr:MAG: YicC family protein [Deltaproteobacteria bacterium]
MIKSMTGYGSAERSVGDVTISVEIRTLNHKSAELSLKLPRRFYPIEQEIRRRILSVINRGRIEVFIERKGGEEEARVVLHPVRARRYYDLLRRLGEMFALDAPIRLEHLLTFPDIFDTEEEPGTLSESEVARLQEALETALERLDHSRREEGSRLLPDFKARIGRLLTIIEEIERGIPGEIEAHTKRLKERIEALTGLSGIDEARWALEVALLAEKGDITEEIVRLKSHLTHFGEVIELDEPNGKRLEFIAQEMSREINTIGMKVNSDTIARLVVAAKNEIVRFREQLPNIE